MERRREVAAAGAEVGVESLRGCVGADVTGVDSCFPAARDRSPLESLNHILRFPYQSSNVKVAFLAKKRAKSEEFGDLSRTPPKL